MRINLTPNPEKSSYLYSVMNTPRYTESERRGQSIKVTRLDRKSRFVVVRITRDRRTPQCCFRFDLTCPVFIYFDRGSEYRRSSYLSEYVEYVSLWFRFLTFFYPVFEIDFGDVWKRELFRHHVYIIVTRRRSAGRPRFYNSRAAELGIPSFGLLAAMCCWWNTSSSFIQTIVFSEECTSTHCRDEQTRWVLRILLYIVFNLAIWMSRRLRVISTVSTVFASVMHAIVSTYTDLYRFRFRYGCVGERFKSVWNRIAFDAELNTGGFCLRASDGLDPGSLKLL